MFTFSTLRMRALALTTKQGELLKCAEELVKECQGFLQGKFAATTVEQGREMTEIPVERLTTAGLTHAEFEAAVCKMKNNKAVGPDGISAEIFKY